MGAHNPLGLSPGSGWVPRNIVSVRISNQWNKNNECKSQLRIDLQPFSSDRIREVKKFAFMVKWIFVFVLLSDFISNPYAYLSASRKYLLRFFLACMVSSVLWWSCRLKAGLHNRGAVAVNSMHHFFKRHRQRQPIRASEGWNRKLSCHWLQLAWHWRKWSM